MTEREWLCCGRRQQLLDYLRRKAPVSQRKVHLFSCACCRRVWDLIWSRRSLQAVLVREAYLDRLPGGERLPMSQRSAREALAESPKEPGTIKATEAAYRATRNTEAFTQAETVSKLCAEAVAEANKDLGAWGMERAAQATVLRNIVGNPFRPLPPVDPAWLEWNQQTVLRLAQTIHEEGRFDEVPVLADALIEAGCDSEPLLDHLRSGQHYRGCWAMDLLLGLN